MKPLIIKKTIKTLVVLVTLAAVITAALFYVSSPALAAGGLSPEGSLFIPIGDVTEKAVFYPLNIDGVDMEIFAVKAPDGTIRTAFNTCQVCYGSGYGYFVQEGDAFVCQNCGNSFRTGDIEKVKGGCNPLPITAGLKTVDEKGITISKELLERAKPIFANWKTSE